MEQNQHDQNLPATQQPQNTQAQQQRTESTGNNYTDVTVWGIEKNYDIKTCLRHFRKNFIYQDTSNPALNFKYTHISKPFGKPYFYIRFESGIERERFFIDPISKNRKVRVKQVHMPIEGEEFLTIEEVMKAGQKREIKAATADDLEKVKNTDIRTVVEPLFNLPYEEQLAKKRQDFEKIIETYNTQFFRDNEVRILTTQFNRQFAPLKLTQFIPCTGKKTEYRNKTEFTIGVDMSGEIKVGFNKGNFSNNTVMIEDPRSVSIVSKRTKIVAAVTEQFIKAKSENNTNQFRVFDRINQKGFWRYLVVRESARTNQVLVMMVAALNNLEDREAWQKVSEELVELYRRTVIGLKGVCFMDYNQNSDSIPIEKPQILWGNGYYHEKILNTNFQVSSSAFLQGHTEMCEVLYSKIVQLVSDCDVVLDLCCGIGTIGICIKNQNPNLTVYGVQCCAEAVEDAKINDPNYEVICAKVENAIKDITDKYRGQRIVGILDPPRAGVSKDVITALRRCRGLDHIIYVACSPQSIMDNLLQLTLPVNNKRKAPHFEIKQCYGFDLFPQTSHFEGLYYLERT